MKPHKPTLRKYVGTLLAYNIRYIIYIGEKMIRVRIGFIIWVIVLLFFFTNLSPKRITINTIPKQYQQGFQED